MPDSFKLNQVLKGKISIQKQLLLNEVSKNSTQMEGILTVNEQHGRYVNKKESTINKVSQYAKNFSSVADLVDICSKPPTSTKELPAMFHFANAIKQKAQVNVVKLQLKQGLNHKMEEAKNERLQ